MRRPQGTAGANVSVEADIKATSTNKFPNIIHCWKCQLPTPSLIYFLEVVRTCFDYACTHVQRHTCRGHRTTCRSCFYLYHGSWGTDLRSQTQRQVPAFACRAVLSTLRTMLLKLHLFSVLRIEPIVLCVLGNWSTAIAPFPYINIKIHMNSAWKET